MLRVVAASRKWPRNGLSPGWLDCATGARYDEVENPTPSRSMAKGRGKKFSQAAPATPRLPAELREQVSRFKDLNLGHAGSRYRSCDSTASSCCGSRHAETADKRIRSHRAQALSDAGQTNQCEYVHNPCCKQHINRKRRERPPLAQHDTDNLWATKSGQVYLLLT